jgi:hypothetical protein
LMLLLLAAVGGGGGGDDHVDGGDVDGMQEGQRKVER